MFRAGSGLVSQQRSNAAKSCRRLLATHVTSAKIEDVQDPEWSSALPFDKIPGPSKVKLLRDSLPGGIYYKKEQEDVIRAMRDKYGDIIKIPKMLGKPGMILSFNPEDYKKVFRTEGAYPIRNAFFALEYYRTNVRPEVYAEAPGLITSQEKKWAEFRTTVNPVMMQPKVVRQYVPAIDSVAIDFIKRIKDIRNPETLEMPGNFEDELNRWALESIGYIALDARLGVITNYSDPKPEKVINAVKAFFSLTFELDYQPSIWKYYETPKFKQLIETLDTITDINGGYIEEAKKRLEATTDKPTDREQSVLEKLLKINPVIAKSMALDMMLAGVDTTSSALAGLLYLLAKNPEKQQNLRKEILEILPTKDSKLTAENMNRMPYITACIKEALRIIPVTGGNIRATGQDLVLGGFQVPKSTNVAMNTFILMSKDDVYPQSNKFIPERWLKDSKETSCPSAKTAHPFVYLPFGFGPRMCIGRRFAELEIKVLTTRLLRNFFIEWKHEDYKTKAATINIPACELKYKMNDIVE